MMMKRSYFSAGSDGIGGSGGSRRSLGYGSGSGSNSGGGRASLGLGSGSGVAADDDIETVLTTRGWLSNGASFATVAFGGAAGAPYVKLNAGQHAPLRCKYPDAMMPAFAEAIRRRELPPADRIGLLSDAAALSRAGDLDFEQYDDEYVGKRSLNTEVRTVQD